jgi:putative peptidoglycan lipid II flippase
MGRFAAWSGAPLLLNILMIGSLLLLTPFVSNHGTALSWGVLAAGVAQFLLLWVVLARADQPLYPTGPRMTASVKTLFAKMLPGIIGAGVFQINVFVDIWIGSFLAVGSLTYLHAADRLNQLPLSVIGIAISTAFLPTLSKLFQTQEYEKAQTQFTQALSYAMILTIPAACALFVLAHPIAKVLFERGAFGAADTLATAHTLQAFVIGLPAYVLAKVLSTGFFARQNTLTPVRIGCLCVGVNFALNLLFMFQTSLGYVGIALATALSSWVNVVFLSVRLNRDHIKVLTRPMASTMTKIALASGVMMGTLAVSKAFALPLILGQGGPLPWMLLVGLVSMGLVSYFGCAHMIQLIDIKQFYGRIKRR